MGPSKNPDRHLTLSQLHSHRPTSHQLRSGESVMCQAGFLLGPIAQLIEHMPRMQGVPGSNPDGIPENSVI